MNRQHIELARQIRRELADGNNGEVNLDAAKQLFVERVVIDVEASKLAAAEQAFQGLEFARPHVSPAQMKMPGLPPDEDEYLNIGPNLRVCAANAKLHHFVLADQQDDLKMEDVQQRKMKRRERMMPLMEYFIAGLSWRDAAAAYQRDHPESATGS